MYQTLQKNKDTAYCLPTLAVHHLIQCFNKGKTRSLRMFLAIHLYHINYEAKSRLVPALSARQLSLEGRTTIVRKRSSLCFSSVSKNASIGQMAVLLLIYTSTGYTTHGLLTTGSPNRYPQSSVTTGGSLAPFVKSLEQIHLQRRSKHSCSRPNNVFEDLPQSKLHT